jgi:MarR family transcriptional regulator, transcriptional regulator for hemolysin
MKTEKSGSLNDLPVGRDLAIIARMYYGVLTKKLESLDIDRHFSVLIYLDECTESCSQKCISDQLLIDKASMVRVIDYLSDKGYISREINKTDRREHSIVLTPKARKALPKIKSATRSLNEKLFKGLSRKEINSFYLLMDNMKSILQREPGKSVTFNFKTAGGKK